MSQEPLLIVDDETDFLEIFQARLAAAGYRVETAQSGEEGIRKTKALKPALVLMDVKMPGMDGTHAAQAIHDDPDLGNVKIVFLTSLGDPSLIRQEIARQFSKNFGFQDYIKKTDDLDVTVERVKSILAQ